MSRIFTIPVEFRIILTEEDIDDIMSSALDGGICYWCREAKVMGQYLGTYASEQISRGGKLQLYDAKSVQSWFLTLGRLIDGIKLWYAAGFSGNVVRCDGTVDTCRIDGAVADSIIQFALFGEIVFG